MLTDEQKKRFIRDASDAQAKDFTAIANWLQRRRITKLFHFTHVDNLDSIFENGFQTRQFLNETATTYFASDNDRLDGFLESISFSIGKPNSLLLSDKNFKLDHKMVLLEVSANNLLTQSFAALPSNAAKGYFQDVLSKDHSRFLGIRGLAGMYLNEELRRKASLPLEEPTDIQAEILFFEPIDNSKILGMHVPERFPESDRDKVTKIMSKYPNLRCDYVCKCGYFVKLSGGPFRQYNIGWEING